MEGSALHYFTPDLLSDFIKPEIGFRGALGYEFKNFRFAAESGFSRIHGTNPLVLEISFIPLVFKFGYHWQFFSIFGLQADLNIGAAFSNTLRYETAVDVIFNNLNEDSETSLLSGTRLYLTVSPFNYFKIYAGGGLDVIFENDGAIPLVLLEFGISIKPFMLTGSIARQIKRGSSSVNKVFFESNSAVIVEQYISVLDETGYRLRENPSLQITLYVYHTLRGVEKQVRYGNGDPALSSARASFCAEYLAKNYEIDLSRVSVVYRKAANRNELYRCIELIVR